MIDADDRSLMTDFEIIGSESLDEEVLYREYQKVIDAGIDPFNYFD